MRESTIAGGRTLGHLSWWRGLFARVLLAGLVLAGLVVGMAVTLGVASTASRRSATAVAHSDQVLASSFLIERGLVDVETGVRAFAATGARLFLAPADQARAVLPGELRTLRRLVSDQPAQQRRAIGLRAAVVSYVDAYALPLSLRSRPLGRRELIISFARGKLSFDSLRARFDRFNTVEEALRVAQARRAASTSATLALVRLATTVAILVALAGLMISVLRLVVIPLRRAIEACARVAAGERGELLGVTDRTELGELARSFNLMVAQLAAGEGQLRDSERRHREIVETSIDAFISTDHAGLITGWNSAAQALFGWSSEEAVGRTVAEAIVPARLRTRHQTGLERLATAGTSSVIGQRLELPALRRDGSEILVEILISRSARASDGFHAFVHDISDRDRARRALEHERRQLDDAQAIARVGSWSWEPSTDHTEWSSEMHRIFDRDRTLGPAVSESFFACLHPADRDRIAAGYVDAFGSGDDFDLNYRIIIGEGEGEGEGEVRFVHAIGHREGKGRYVGTVQDVTGPRLAQETLREAEERFRGAFEEAPIGMALVTLDGRWEKVNDALSKIIGYSREQLEGTRVESITHPDDVGKDLEAMAEMRTGARSTYSVEKRYLHASGHPVFCALQATLILAADGLPVSFLSQIQDITDRKRNEDRLEYLADHDALTGLLNRRAFARELATYAALAERYGEEGTILMVDLDQFKFVNDTLGHQAGDELIVRVAQLLSERLRDTDVVARLGGDEFAVLLPKAGPSAAKLVANSVLDTLRSEGIQIAGTERQITASIGIASFKDSHGLSGEEVLINADLALYDAKEDGRDRLATFSTDQYSQARMKGRITWAQRITTALETDGFALLAQPIVDLATGRTSQYELLLRMRDEHGDLIPPSTFLYIAERLDVIKDIDAWVVTNGINILAELDPVHEFALEINLSGRSLGDPKLLEHIDTELRRTDVAPDRIIFEITETAALTSVTKARAFGEHLSEIGCRFALDDFGAGFGSFYYLKHLLFDYLKIDGEFIRECRSNPTDKLVIKAIVDIARGMSKQTIAEFVSDDETVALLTRLGVDYGQGYHLGKPAPLDQQLSPQLLR